MPEKLPLIEEAIIEVGGDPGAGISSYQIQVKGTITDPMCVEDHQGEISRVRHLLETTFSEILDQGVGVRFPQIDKKED
jgi:hypothetical protein